MDLKILLNHKNVKKIIKCSRKNFKSLFIAGIVLAVGVSNLHISSNENDQCHSANITSPGNIKGRTNHSRPLFASSLASSWTYQSTWESTFSLLPWLSLTYFEQDRPTFSSLTTESSPLNIMRRAHPIYGPLVSGKSFFHHSSFLLNQRILGETNWIFLIPALTSAS